MNLPQYEVTPDENLYKFTFISEGKNGKVEKIVLYEEINEGVFNLAFGDKDITTGHINDRIVTNNGDTEKVLATVISTVYTFLTKTLMLIYLQLEVLTLAIDYIDAGLQSTYKKLLNPLKFMKCYLVKSLKYSIQILTM
jgi:hypothetical protein